MFVQVNGDQNNNIPLRNGIQNNNNLLKKNGHYQNGTSLVRGQLSSNVTNLAVNIENVSFIYGSGESVNYALYNVSLHVPRGTIYGLLGPSGCGKTSLLRCVVGCAVQDKGSIRVFGLESGHRKSDIPGPGVGYMPQDIALHDDLTINEMITYFGKLAFKQASYLRKMTEHLVTALNLPDSETLIATLSGGQKRRTSFACALINKPKLLILDEPTVGVDPILREKIWDILIELTQKENVTVILTTHYIEETKRSNIVGFMRRGTLLAEGSPQTMLAKFECETLEDVFYKLCYQQKKERKSIRISIAVDAPEVKLIKTTVSELKNNMVKFNLAIWYSIFSTVLWKVIIQSKRQKMTSFLQTLFPIISLIIYYVCIGGIPFDMPLAIVNQESPPYLSELFIKNIDQHFLIPINYDDLKSAIEAVRKRKAIAAVHIKPNFSESLIHRFENLEDFDTNFTKEGAIMVHADLSHRVLSITLERSLEEAFQRFAEQALQQLNYNPRLLEVPIKVDEIIYGTIKAVTFGLEEFYLPGIMIILVYTFSFAGTLLLTMNEKEDKIYERNKVAGVTPSHTIVAHVVWRFAIMSVTVTILFFIATMYLNMSTKGSIFWALILLYLQVLTGLTHGIFMSTFCNTLHMATVISNGVILFMFIISGVLWSVDSLPYWIRWASYFSPATLPTETLRFILTRGASITDFVVYRSFLISIFYSFLFISSSIFLF